MRTLITDRTLRGLKPAPAGKRTVIWDSAVPGLCVRVTDKGAASFSVMRRVKGSASPVRRVLGIGWTVPFPAGQPLPYSLALAREDARAMVLKMAKGIDPKEEEREQAGRRANTFAAVAETFIAKHVSKLRSRKPVEASIRRELIKRWGDRPITEITQRDVGEMVEAIADSGRPYAAHRAFAYTSKLFAWAKARQLITASPCTDIHTTELAGKKEPRQRVLSGVEVGALWRAVNGLGYPAAPFTYLLLLTGQRLREVANMAWQEIDLEKALWTIPPERMKGNTAHEVPLSPATVAILKALPRWSGPYIFSNMSGEKPISGFSSLKTKIDRALPDAAAWRFHDLRRTMRTGLGGLPIPTNVAELCIAQAQTGLHKVYDQHSYRDEKRRAFTLWAERLHAIVNGTDGDNVVTFTARGREK
jgi:integrase